MRASSNSSSSNHNGDMDVTLIGEEINMETPNANATLYLQLFDEDDDVDDLIGDIELQLGEYLNVDDPDVNGTWMTLNNYKKKGELRIFIQFQKRELGPSAIRKLNNR